MYKKLIDLQDQLQADKKQLEKDVERLQALADQAAPAPFDEVLAASRITATRTDDHLNGTKTADDVILKVDKERSETAKKINTITADKAKAQQQLTLKAAALQAADTEISRLNWKIKALIAEAAQQRVIGKIEDYGRLASDLMTVLIEIDALNAIINEDPTGVMAKQVFRVESLPTLGLESVEPWLIQAAGEKLILPREQAFQAVHHRHEKLIEDIKGELYGN